MSRAFDDVPTVRDGDCLIWQGELSHNGYGRYCLGWVNRVARRVAAHRYAWERVHGPIPDGLQIDHLCKRRACVNVDHLEAVTPWENNRRSTSPSARNLVVTECPHGHPYEGDNLYVTPKGARDCRTCRREAIRRLRMRVRSVV